MMFVWYVYRYKYNMNNQFIRPNGISSGVLLNTDNTSLEIYKKTKKRLSSVNTLQEQVDKLSCLVNLMAKQLGINNDDSNNTH